MAADLGVVRAVQAVAAYLALTWLGIFCFGFAVITALLEWGGLASGVQPSRRFRLVLVALGAFGLVASAVGIGGLMFG